MVQTTIRFPEELYLMLKEKAKKKGLTLNAFLISVLWNVGDIYEVGKKGEFMNGERDSFFDFYGISKEEEEFFKIIYRRRQIYRRIIYILILIIAIQTVLLCTQ